MVSPTILMQVHFRQHRLQFINALQQVFRHANHARMSPD
jgi:hypothetical protein